MRTGSNQRSWGEMRRTRKNGISRARAIPGKKVTGRERGKGEGWAGQKAHDGGLCDGVAEASRALSEAVVAVLSATRTFATTTEAARARACGNTSKPCASRYRPLSDCDSF